MAEFKIYDSENVTVSLGGIPVESGLADGEFCKVEQVDDDFTSYVGTDGSVTRTRTRNRTATVTLTVAQTAEVNSFLSALSNADRSSTNGAGVVPLLIRDRGGSCIYKASKAWIQKPPSVTFGKETSTREWTIFCADLERFDGGN
jgi:hypothetical protein